MMTPSCDSLEPIPKENWPKLIEKSREKWPFGLTAYNMLMTQCIHLKKIADYPVEIFAPFGDPDNGIVCILSLIPTAYEISVFCFKCDTSKLTDALVNTKHINWTKRVMFCNIMQEHIQCVQDALNKLQKIPTTMETQIVHLSKDEAMLFDTQLPEDVSLQILPPEMADELNNAWPHKYPGSLEYFRGMLSRGTVIGVVNEGVRAWGLVSGRGYLHGITTKPEHRRKGYAQLIVKVLSKRLAEEGREVFACIMKTNEPSMKLFNDLGFKTMHTVTSLTST